MEFYRNRGAIYMRQTMTITLLTLLNYLITVHINFVISQLSFSFFVTDLKISSSWLALGPKSQVLGLDT